ncbi:hypothetical protein BBJ28_00019637 [Nothophytophthora sp. Chile5]|nr:hypothetical protein BBJ28_00019637 [Nothophytophthora sp. Chile5]
MDANVEHGALMRSISRPIFSNRFHVKGQTRHGAPPTAAQLDGGGKLERTVASGEMFGAGDDGKHPISTLILAGEKEQDYHCQDLEQTITVTLERANDSNAKDEDGSAVEDVGIPIILSRPSTARFELSSCSPQSSSPLFMHLLRYGSALTCTVKFRRPLVSEGDFLWDNFQDHVVVHTRLSKLVVRLEAWKSAAPQTKEEEEAGEPRLLFPASLPDVKAPPLRLFHEIERDTKDQEQQQEQQSPPGDSRDTEQSAIEKAEENKVLGDSEALPRLQTPRMESLPSLSRPGSRDRQSPSHPIKAVQPSHPVVIEVQSQREAREVILKLRSRRTSHGTTGARRSVLPTTSFTANAEDASIPETLALDAGTKAELEQFNQLVVTAKDHVAREAAKAKGELEFYRHLLHQTPPQGERQSSVPKQSGITTELPLSLQKTGKTRQMSAASKRPAKLPSLARPSSGSACSPESATSAAKLVVNNQELSPSKAPRHQSARRLASGRQRTSKAIKLQSLSASVSTSQCRGEQQADKATSKPPADNRKASKPKQQKRPEDPLDLSDFDDPDPEVDEAPSLPDDLSGVATLDDDDMCY